MHLCEIFWAFLQLGCTSFGGPVAHLGYFRTEFVEKRKWLDDASYADLVALCQFLPGPASSQVCFALGLQRGGWRGGLLASLAFTLPSALLMMLFAWGVTRAEGISQAGWLHGLKVAAVAVVAHAVWGMAKNLCPDRARATLAILATVGVLAWTNAWSQVAVIFLGAAAGWVWLRATDGSTPAVATSHHGPRGGIICLVIFLVLLAGLPWVARAHPDWALFDSLYRAGAFVFGGGHVVLPLLRAEVVPPGWLRDDVFLAGYGAAQAVPGPLFTLAAFVGTAAETPWQGWRGGVLGLIAIFSPALLLVGAALPYWQRLRRLPSVQSALRGANAAVVGVLLAALYQPVWIEGIRRPTDVMLGLICFGLLQWWKTPAWLVVGLAAGCGYLLF